MNKPILIEPGVSYWLNNVLNKSRKFREKNINLVFNISMSFLFIISIFLQAVSQTIDINSKKIYALSQK